MSEFKNFQKDVCDLPEPIEPSKKVCPTCEPDESYIEPTWWETEKPYLHKGLCEYRVSITSKENPRGFSTNAINALGYKSAQQGLIKILREFDKLQTNQILCAYPPDSMNDRDCPTYVPPEVYRKLSEIELFRLKLPDQKQLEDRLNPFSLEYSAKVEDFYLGDSLETFKILISIPAEFIDRLPGDAISDEEAEEIDEEASTVESVEFKGKQLKIRTRELSSTFRLYSKYQQVGYIVNKISLLQENDEGEEVKFRIIKFVKRKYFKDFREGLEDLLEKNGFKFRNFDSFKTADRIKFVFDKTNSNKPYTIKAIFAAKKGCPYEKMKKLSTIRNIQAFKDQTFMHYIANLENLTDQLRQGAEVPWLDFIVDNTYPALAVDFGDIDNGEDSSDTCLDKQALDNLKDDLLGEVMSFAEVLKFAFSSSGCSPLDESIPVNKLKLEFKTKQARKLNRAKRKAERKAERAAEKARKQEIEKLKEEARPEIEIIEAQIKLAEESLKESKKDFSESPSIVNLEKQISFEQQIISKKLEIELLESAWKKQDKTDKAVLSLEIKKVESDKKIIDYKIEQQKQILKDKEKQLKDVVKSIDSGVLSLESRKEELENDIEKAKSLLQQFKNEQNKIKEDLKKRRYNRRNENGVGKTFNLTSDKVKAATEDALKDFKPFGLIEDIQEAVKNRETKGEFKLRNILSVLNPCKWNIVTFDVISCLLGGMSLQEAIPIIVKKSLQNSSPILLEQLFVGLSPEKQQEVAAKVKQKLEEAGVQAIDNILTPWEEAKQKVVEETVKTSSKKRKAIINGMEIEAEEVLDSASMQEIKKSREKLKKELKKEKKGLKSKQEALTELINENLETIFIDGGSWDQEALESEISLYEQEITELEEQLETTKKEIDEKRQDEERSTSSFGDISVIVFQAYIEALIESLPVDDLLSFIDRIPGAKIFKKIFLTATCPTANSFKLNLLDKLPDLLRVEFCKDGGNGWAFPKIPKLPELIIPDIKWLLKQLIQVLQETLINFVADLLIALILKVLDLLNSALCNSIAALGKFLADAVKGEASLDGLLEAISDAFCNDPNNAPNTMDNLLGRAGIPSSRRSDIASSISRAASKNDIKKAFLNGNSQDPRAMKSIYAAIVGNGGFEDTIQSPDDVADIFTIMGSFLSPEQKIALSNSLDEFDDSPVDQSICLTNSQKQLWDEQREDFWINQGIDRDAAKDYVKKLNNNAQDDLGNLLDIFNKGPEGILGEALDKALQAPNEPDCVDQRQELGSSTSILPTMPQQIKDILSELSDGMFKTLFFSFTRDMIGSRNSYFDNVLADMRGVRLSSGFFNHQRRVDYNLLFPNAADTEEQHAEKLENARFITKRFMEGFDGEAQPNHLFPQTVGIYMKDQLDSNLPIDFSPSDESTTIQLTYQNENYGGSGDNSESQGPDFKFNLNYYNHIPNQDYTHNDLYRIGKVDRNLTKEDSFARSLDYRLDISHGLNNILKTSTFQIPENLSRPYVEQVFVEQIKSTFAETSATFNDGVIAKLYDKINSSIINHLIPKLTSIEDAFEFGYQSDEIGYEDLLYVNPEATSNEDTWEYTYEEDEQVLGKSATDNPRIKFLDPATHGGRYTRPKFYIEPAEHSGMFRKLQMVVPEFDGCDPSRSDFLNLKEISDKVSSLQNSIPMDERMTQEPDCRVEPPFDKLHTSNGLAYLEGVMKATIRTYVVEFILRSIPFVSTIKFNSFNYDDAVLEMIIDKIEDGHRRQDKNFSRIRRYNYWILFVEELVTATFRQVESGEIKPTQDLKDTLTDLNKISDDYYNPTRLDRKYLINVEDLVVNQNVGVVDVTFKNNLTPSASRKSKVLNIINALCFYAYGPYWKKRLTKMKEEGKKPKRIKFVTLRRMKTATRMFDVHNNIELAKKVVKYHVNNELEYYSSLLDETMKPQSPIYDINKYLIGASKFFSFSDIESGLAEVESPVGDSTSIDYGSIPSCPTSIEAGFTHFDGKTYTAAEFEKIKSEGVFHLEKFVYIVPKQNSNSVLSSLVSNLLPEGGVMSIGQFRGLINQLTNEQKNINISEALGDAIFETDDNDNPVGLLGTIGLQFGVRICYTPPEASYDFYDNVTITEGNKFKSYRFKSAMITVDGVETRYFAPTHTFPIATFKQDVIDKKISEIDLDDDNLGEDLKCYVDQLCLTEDFRLSFQHLFITKKLVSLLLMYSYDGFVESIGLSQDEREDDSLGSKGRWKSKILKNTKKQLRNLFAGFYREMEDMNEKEENDSRGIGLDFLKSFSPASLINLNGSVKWWQLRRLVDRPYDKDGNDCDDGIF